VLAGHSTLNLPLPYHAYTTPFTSHHSYYRRVRISVVVLWSNVVGFLRSRREKAKQKKSKKKVKDNVDTQSNKEEKSDM
jgi:hypothetical protein